MAERKRSKDMRRETEELPLARGGVSQQGRDQGRLARKIGARDEEKRATERPAGATRVRGADKDESESGEQSE
ncbi:hypothetical protein [Rhodosalinus sp.]|uniref:hypothetical protein n=1 Tax=Rhodosalinus sp. TaxID=2047741 RepID=UPI0035618770